MPNLVAALLVASASGRPSRAAEDATRPDVQHPRHVRTGLQIAGRITRRELGHVCGAAIFAPLAASANTEAMLSEPMTGFSAGEAKRAEFLEKQKKYKKAWRKEISNLEFATNDAEFEAALEALYKVFCFVCIWVIALSIGVLDPPAAASMFSTCFRR